MGTDGMRSLWKVPVDVSSKNRRKKSAACYWVGERRRRLRCAVDGFVEQGSSAYSADTGLFGVCDGVERIETVVGQAYERVRLQSC